MAKIKVNISGVAVTGKIVTFTAPCDCTEATGLLIGGDTYNVVDALGNCITGSYLAWRGGAVVSVALDCENKKAFIQNAAIPEITPESIGAAAEDHTHSAADITEGILPVANGGTGVTSLEGNNGLLKALHPNASVIDYIATIGKSFNGNGFCSPAQLAAAMGAAKIEVGSYAGTNTYGSSNPCSLTFSFAPKFVCIAIVEDTEYPDNTHNPAYSNIVLFPSMLTTEYAARRGFTNFTTSSPSQGNTKDSYAKISADGKTVYWYNTNSAELQCNGNQTYYWYVLG